MGWVGALIERRAFRVGTPLVAILLLSMFLAVSGALSAPPANN